MKYILVTIFFSLTLVANSQFIEGNQNKDIIKVKGEFISKQKPENLIVNLKVTETNSDYQKCFDSAFKTRKKMIESFDNNGINKNSIKTKDLSVEEQYRWEKNKEKPRYKAYINMQIEEKYSDEFANKLLKSLQEYSFQVNYSISFTLSDSQKKILRQIAIEQAVKDATEKAEIISKAAKVNLGDINRITYGDTWAAGYNNGIDDDLILDMEYDLSAPVTRQVGFYDKGIDFNPKEISIKKVVMIEWNILKNNK